MPLNFVETIKSYFSPAFIEQVAKSLNESKPDVTKAFSAIIPVGLAGISNMATSGKERANSIFDMAKSESALLSASPDVEDLHNKNGTTDFLAGIFGGNESELLDSISNFADIQISSTSALMSVAMPYMMGFLGKHAAQNNLSASGLSGFLSSQQNNILQALPSELSSLNSLSEIGSFPSDSNVSTTHIKYVTKIIDNLAKTPEIEPLERQGGLKWLVPLILIIIVIALVWYFTRGEYT